LEVSSKNLERIELFSDKFSLLSKGERKPFESAALRIILETWSAAEALFPFHDYTLFENVEKKLKACNSGTEIKNQKISYVYVVKDATGKVQLFSFEDDAAR
jgi:hypothetical protein